jgi:hypothetical protein
MVLLTLKSPFRTARGRDSVSGGNVLYPRDGRQFARQHVVGADPLTSSQGIIRGYIATASAALQQVSDSEWANWIALAGSLVRLDPNRNSYSLRPVDAYLSVQLYRQIAGLEISNVAPPPGAPPDPPRPTSIARFPSGGGSYDLTIDHDREDGYWIVEMTDALPGLVRRARKNEFRLWSLDQSSAIVPVSESPQIISIAVDDARFAPAANDRVAVRLGSLSPGFVVGARASRHVIVGDGAAGPQWTEWSFFNAAESFAPSSGEPWQNPENVLESAGFSHWNAQFSASTSEAFRTTNLFPELPGTSEILAVEIRVSRSKSLDASQTASDFAASLIADGSPIVDSKPDPDPWSFEPELITYTWSDALGDTMPSVETVNATDFGFNYRATAEALQAGRIHAIEGRIQFNEFP